MVKTLDPMTAGQASAETIAVLGGGHGKEATWIDDYLSVPGSSQSCLVLHRDVSEQWSVGLAQAFVSLEP